MSQRSTVEDLVARCTTYAEEGGITLRDKPSPLFQLLVLTTLASTRISAGIAAHAARELFAAGWRTPEKLRDATWQQRVEALGRGGYRRYDESTSTTLEESASFLISEYGGDLRRLRPGNGDEASRLPRRIEEFPRIGPTGAGIFCREVQAVWPHVQPFFDGKAMRAARRLGLPDDPARLARLAPGGDVARLSAALAAVG